MKKLFVVLISVFMLSSFADAQKRSGNYIQVGTSVDASTWSQEVQFGGFIGKHQLGLLVQSSGEEPIGAKERPWYGGVAYQFSTPIAKTISFLANGEARVNLRGEQSDLILEPGIGLGFNISPTVQFQTGVSSKFNKDLEWNGTQGQVDIGLNFKF